MTKERYFLMCEQFGEEPKESEIPLDMEDLSYEAQLALIIFNTLPDIIEGMNGIYLGKNFSGIDSIMDMYGAKGNRLVFELLQVCIREYMKHSAEERNRQERMGKFKK